MRTFRISTRDTRWYATKGYRFSCLVRHTIIGAVLALLCWPGEAQAAINSTGLLDTALQSFQTSAAGWAAYITARASWLFWTLATISLVWTMGQLALRRAEIGEFLGEFLSFTLMTGFFWWLLTNGPTFAVQIMNSMRQLAGSASGLGPSVYPSTLADIGFQLLDRVMTQSSVWQPVDSAVGFVVCLIILIVVALIAINMLVLLVSGWILAYAGIFFLGFGGSRWTSDMAINYYRTVLSLGAQLAGMVLVVGIGFSFINLYYVNMSSQVSVKEMAVLMVAAIVLLGLVNKIPPLLGGLAMGGGVGALGRRQCRFHGCDSGDHGSGNWTRGKYGAGRHGGWGGRVSRADASCVERQWECASPNTDDHGPEWWPGWKWPERRWPQ